MPNNHKITFVIFTFNEEQRLENVLLNFIKFGDILVVDNHSSDKTQDIAKKYGCKFLLNKNEGWVEDETTYNNVIKNIATDWVYWGYCDELLNLKTINKIMELIKINKYEILELNRVNYFYGDIYPNLFNSYQPRVFKVGSISFKDNKIHHFGKRICSPKKIYKINKNYYIHHFISNDSRSLIQTIDKYSFIESTTAIQKNTLINVLVLLKYIFFNLILLNSFKLNIKSIYFGMHLVYYYFLVQIRSYERENSISVKNIEKKNNKHRESIINEFTKEN
jgi:hypothetical protein